MAMMEVDTNQDGQVSIDEFVPLFHVIMREMVKAKVVQEQKQPDELSQFLIACCQEFDIEGTGYLKEQKLAKALREADLGLTKFQIMTVVGQAESGAHGIQYEPFMLDQASTMIGKMLESDSEMMYKRTAAWKQIQEAEEEAEMILGFDKDQFSAMISGLFHEYDADRSGALDPDEFERAIRNSGIPFSETQIRMLMAAADLNEDGLIEYGEFAHVALKLMEYFQQEERIMHRMATLEEEGENLGDDSI